MNKRKTGSFTIIVTAVILLLVFLFVAYSIFHRDRPQIVLPPEDSSSDVLQNGEGDGEGNTVVRVEVNPQTVQNVIATLARPEAYMRTMTITTFWSGGSGVTSVDVYVDGGCMRMDTTLPGGQVRHMIRTDTKAYVWYNSERNVYSGELGAFSEDDEGWIPTYEDLLEWEQAQIAAADYEPYQEIDCIYAQTVPDRDGYSERYWVSVETGLLVAAERLQGATVVYKMEALSVLVGAPEEERFTLPDGTVLAGA